MVHNLTAHCEPRFTIYFDHFK